MLDLWLIRHGETDWNAEGRIQGHTDTPLNELGVRQARRLAERLARVTFDHVFASDLTRAATTAEIVLGHDRFGRDDRLRELNMGRFEGQLYNELESEEMEELYGWWMGDFEHKIGGGESGADFQRRVESWLEGLPDQGRVAAFAHGGTLRTVLASRLSPERDRVLYRMGNTCITRLQLLGPRTTVVTLNDTAHLEPDLGGLE